jgi:hypothetical protein
LVAGGEGKDFVDGGSGADRMLGGEGTDLLIDNGFDEAFKDIVSGGGGDDIFLTDHVPAVRDIVSCGTGFDRAIVDRKDVVAPDCERVRLIHGTVVEATEQEQAFFESLPPAVSEFFFGTFWGGLTPDPTAGG